MQTHIAAMIHTIIHLSDVSGHVINTINKNHLIPVAMKHLITSMEVYHKGSGIRISVFPKIANHKRLKPQIAPISFFSFVNLHSGNFFSKTHQT